VEGFRFLEARPIEENETSVLICTASVAGRKGWAQGRAGCLRHGLGALNIKILLALEESKLRLTDISIQAECREAGGGSCSGLLLRPSADCATRSWLA